MQEPDSKNDKLPMTNDKLHKNVEDVEWYSGKDLYTHPRRVKVRGVWEDVFHYEKVIREDAQEGTREIVFRCHIGDNRIVEVIKPLLTKE